MPLTASKCAVSLSDAANFGQEQSRRAGSGPSPPAVTAQSTVPKKTALGANHSDPPRATVRTADLGCQGSDPCCDLADTQSPLAKSQW